MGIVFIYPMPSNHVIIEIRPPMPVKVIARIYTDTRNTKIAIASALMRSASTDSGVRVTIASSKLFIGDFNNLREAEEDSGVCSSMNANFVDGVLVEMHASNDNKSLATFKNVLERFCEANQFHCNFEEENMAADDGETSSAIVIERTQSKNACMRKQSSGSEMLKLDLSKARRDPPQTTFTNTHRAVQMLHFGTASTNFASSIKNTVDAAVPIMNASNVWVAAGSALSSFGCLMDGTCERYVTVTCNGQRQISLTTTNSKIRFADLAFAIETKINGDDTEQHPLGPNEFIFCGLDNGRILRVIDQDATVNLTGSKVHLDVWTTNHVRDAPHPSYVSPFNERSSSQSEMPTSESSAERTKQAQERTKQAQERTKQVVAQAQERTKQVEAQERTKQVEAQERTKQAQERTKQVEAQERTKQAQERTKQAQERTKQVVAQAQERTKQVVAQAQERTKQVEAQERTKQVVAQAQEHIEKEKTKQLRLKLESERSQRRVTP
jgi:hypothetical protein